MTPRIPRGWVVATERGEGVWCARKGGGTWVLASPFTGLLDPRSTYIRRTDDSVPADPNECLRLEDEAARIDERKPEDALPIVPGMMRVDTGDLLPLGSFRVSPTISNRTELILLGYSGAVSWIDDRTPAEFAAAYTAASEYTERRRAEIAEEVRRGGAPTTEPDLGEWPGKPELPPGDERDVQILTVHGVCHGFHTDGWFVTLGWCKHARVDPADVIAWRLPPRATVVDGRVTGVTRG